MQTSMELAGISHFTCRQLIAGNFIKGDDNVDSSDSPIPGISLYITYSGKGIHGLSGAPWQSSIGLSSWLLGWFLF